MKLAPNVKKQPRGIKNKDTEVIIFAGSDAWSHAQQWQEKDGPASGDNVPPVWLGPNQLAELDALKIVPDGKKRVRLYQAGELDLVEIKKIGQKLAAADIQDANFYPEGMHGQKCENWRRYRRAAARWAEVMQLVNTDKEREQVAKRRAECIRKAARPPVMADNFGALKEAVNRTHAVMGMEDAGKSVWRNYPKQPGSNQ
ncbi:PerC family transcriptional regulator [Escherichia coli]|nr:PerC family transcriptional regulator [Escherichia coli]